MTEDIFSFWSRIDDDARMHPDDEAVFKRAGQLAHKFELDCLPVPFFGPLKTAPVVLLFLSPGFHEWDRAHASSESGRLYYREQRRGDGTLPSEEEHYGGYQWWTRIVRQFGPDLLDRAAKRVAIFNIGAYHSKIFHDWHMLSALPSSRRSLDYAQSNLFPEAEAGRRVVVCLRSARVWGLEQGRQYGTSLFAPSVGQSGFMARNPMREVISTAVRAALR